MSTILILNPGTGPIAAARERDARHNVSALCRDLELRAPRISVDRHVTADTDGRYGYRLRRGIRSVTVEMPGLPLDRVRMGLTDDAWQFPRLYVDGSSWLWPFAIRSARSELLDHDGSLERGYRQSVADCDFVMEHEPRCPTCGAIKDRHLVDEKNLPYGYEVLRCVVCTPVEKTEVRSANLEATYGNDSWKDLPNDCVYRLTWRRMPYEALGTDQDPICSIGYIHCRLKHAHACPCESWWKEVARERVNLPYRGTP